MMNSILFIKELKSSRWLFIGICLILTMYVTIIIGMYNPTMMSMMDQFFKTMPGLMAAVGFKAGSTSLLGFLVSYLYGFILMIFPMIFILNRAHGLVARYVDRGSMVVLLTGHNKRTKVILTQIAVLLSSLFGLFVYVTMIQYLTIRVMFPTEADLVSLLKLNFGLYCLWVLIASISFLASTYFSDARLSLAVGMAIPIVMFVFKMISNIDDKVVFLKYFTVFSLFNGEGLLAGEPMANILVLVALVIAFLLFTLAVKIFKEKNLYI